MKRLLVFMSLSLALLCIVLFSGCSDTGNLTGTIWNESFTVKAENVTIGCKSFGDAWKTANAYDSTEVVITCYKDVTAVDGMFGEYGELTLNERTAPLTLDLNGHTIDRALTSPDESGAVFAFFNKTGTVTIKNGTITGGNKTQHGGAFYIDSDNLNLTLESVTITGNNAGINGGGMYINGCNANVTLKNVTVTGNTAGFGGGIHWDAVDDKMANLELSGKVNITYNNVTGDADYSNLVMNLFPSNISKFKFSDFSLDSTINFAYETCVDIPFTDNLGENAAKYKNCFISERAGLKLEINDNNALYLTVDESDTTIAAGVYRESWGCWEYFTSASAAWTETDSHKGHVTMKLYQDWVGVNGDLGTGNGFKDGAIYPYFREDSTLTLDLNNHTINRGLTKETARENGCIIYTCDGDSINMTVKNGTLTGGANKNTGGCLDYRADHGTFWFDNVTIKGNYSAKEGGAIYYYLDECYLCLRDVTITENSNDGKGALYAYSSWGLGDNNLNLYGNIKIKDNTNCDLVMGENVSDPFYTEFSNDIEKYSIALVRDKNTATDFWRRTCVCAGDEQATMDAFVTLCEEKIIEENGVKYFALYY